MNDLEFPWIKDEVFRAKLASYGYIYDKETDTFRPFPEGSPDAIMEETLEKARQALGVHRFHTYVKKDTKKI